MLILKGGNMKRHHMGPIRKHPDRRSCLILTANASVQWTDGLSFFFLLCEPIKFPLQMSTFKIPYNTWHFEMFLAIVDGFLYLEN